MKDKTTVLKSTYKQLIQILLIVLLAVTLIPHIRIDADDEGIEGSKVDTNEVVETVEEPLKSSEYETTVETPEQEIVEEKEKTPTTIEAPEQELVEENKNTPTTLVDNENEQELIASGTLGTDWKIYDYNGERILEICTGELDTWFTSFDSETPWYNYRESITKIIIQENVIAPQSTYSMFSGLSNVTEIIGIENLDVSQSTSFYKMFMDMYSLTSLDLSSWDTQNVVGMPQMFSNMHNLTDLNVSGWNTKNLEYTESMFRGAGSLEHLDLSGWNTESLFSAANMFAEMSSLKTLNLSNWITSNLNDAPYIMGNTTNLETLDLSGWDTTDTHGYIPLLNNAISLKKITIGENFTFTKVGSDFSSITTPGYTGRWIGLNTGTVFNSTDDFMYGYAGQADTYIWEPDSLDMGFHGTWWRVYDTDDDQVLEIYTGELEEMHESERSQPWQQYLDTITKVIIQEDVIAPNIAAGLFASLTQVTEFEGLENLNTENVTDMTDMFYNTSSITSLDLTSWDTRSVGNMNNMFSGMESLRTLNVSNWDTGQVRMMDYTFAQTYNLVDLDISGWNVKNVVTMQGMFHDAGLTTLNLENWNIESLRFGMYMFTNAKSLTSLNLKNWSTKSFFSSVNMFSGTDSLRELVLGTNSKFGGEANLPTITTSGYNGKWMGLKTGTVFNSSDDFMNNYTGQADTYVWQPNSVDMGFHGTWWRVYDTNDDRVLEIYTGELKSMPTSGQSKPWQQYLNTITKVIIQEDVIAPTYSGGMFENLSQVTEFEGIENLNTENVESMSFMFYNCASVTTLDLTSWETKKVKSMSGMFYGMHSLRNLNVSNWNTGAVTMMGDMFGETYSLIDLDISEWDVKNVNAMEGMFLEARSLTQLDLSNWNTKTLWYTASMFKNTKSLTTLNLGNWNTEKLQYSENMFSGADSLNELILGEKSRFNSSVNLPAITTNGYTGKWVGVNTGTSFDSSSDFMNEYAGETDTYVWQKDTINITLPVSMLFENEEEIRTKIVSQDYEVKNNSLSTINVALSSINNVSDISDIEVLKLNDVSLIQHGETSLNEITTVFDVDKKETGVLSFTGESKLLEEEVNPKFNLVFKFSFSE